MGNSSGAKIEGIVPQFLVKDLDRSLAYYTEQLGFEEQFRYEDFYAGVQRDGQTIHLKSGQPNKEERQSRRDNEDLDVNCSVKGIDALYEEFGGKSVEVIQQLRAMPYGREFYVADPDGYVLGFIE
jgi:catechol 2,3-dioxygenase-like lactoylglutathione lyase family enzyme